MSLFEFIDAVLFDTAIGVKPLQCTGIDRALIQIVL